MQSACPLSEGIRFVVGSEGRNVEKKNASNDTTSVWHHELLARLGPGS